MMQSGTFRQTNAFAMQYGLFFGIYWIVGFALFINSLRVEAFGLLYLLLMLSIPFVGWKFTRGFRNRVRGSGSLPFGRLYLFSAALYFFASILLAVAVYIYFAYLDQGAFFQAYADYLNRPEVQKTLFAPSLSAYMNSLGIHNNSDLMRYVQEMQGISPSVWAANVLDMNLFIGLVISLPTAWVASITQRRTR